MSWLIGILTFILVVDCVFLILLVLIQLPKKEAGIGQAFGGTATDALFGAGSGTALTKMTKYATGVFLVLTLGLAVLNAQQSKTRTASFERALQEAGKSMENQPGAPPKPATPTTPVNTNLLTPPAATGAAPGLLLSTNVPATTTNAPK
jgi:preprotein translocase subunit SecG